MLWPRLISFVFGVAHHRQCFAGITDGGQLEKQDRSGQHHIYPSFSIVGTTNAILNNFCIAPSFDAGKSDDAGSTTRNEKINSIAQYAV